jgi:hypothetical protein
MEKHTFLWQYKKEMPDQDGVIKVEVCNGTIEAGENVNEIKIEDTRSKTIKTEDRGKYICCMGHKLHKFCVYHHVTCVTSFHSS